MALKYSLGARGQGTSYNKRAAQDFIGALVVARDHPYLTATGKCPRCDHPTQEYRFPLRVLVSDSPAPAPQPNGDLDTEIFVDRDERVQAGQMTRVFTCNCTSSHAGAESGVDGCGALWKLELDWRATRTPSVVFRPGSRPSRRNVAEEEDRVESAGGALPRARAKAKDWRNVLGGVTGLAALLTLLTTVFTFLTGKDSTEDMSGWWRNGIAVAFLGAIVVGGIGVLLANRAAIGSLDEDYAGDDPGDVRARELGLVLRSTRWARNLFVVSGLLVLGALVAAFAAPSEKPALLKVTPVGTGTVECGALESSSPDVLRIKTSDGRRPQWELSGVKSIAYVHEC